MSVNNAIRAAATAAVATGAILAIPDARNLYNVRNAMSAMYQQDTNTMFPRDLVGNDVNTNFYMSFKFQSYEKRAINSSPFLRSQGTIRLPIPENLRDNTSVSYGSPDLGAAVGAGLESLAGEAPMSGFADVGGAAARSVLAATAGGVAQAAAGTGVGQGAQAYLGLAVNPYQTVLFQRPEFKSHTFSWKFMPRDEQETMAARDIFRTFQYHMLPGVSEGIGLFFSYPSMVVISLYPSSTFLYRFKPCVIKSVSINYAAGSSPSFFRRSAAPTAMTMSVELQEIEYWTNKDYTDSALNESAAIGAGALSAARTGNMRSEVRGLGQFGNTPND